MIIKFIIYLFNLFHIIYKLLLEFEGKNKLTLIKIFTMFFNKSWKRKRKLKCLIILFWSLTRKHVLQRPHCCHGPHECCLPVAMSLEDKGPSGWISPKIYPTSRSWRILSDRASSAFVISSPQISNALEFTFPQFLTPMPLRNQYSLEPIGRHLI